MVELICEVGGATAAAMTTQLHVERLALAEAGSAEVLVLPGAWWASDRLKRQGWFRAANAAAASPGKSNSSLFRVHVPYQLAELLHVELR
jgi:hypothetical protein